MSYLLDAIFEAANAEGIPISMISPVDGQRLRIELANKYADGKTSWPLWDNLRDAASIQDPDGWMWVADYLDSKRTLLLFDEDGDANLFRALELEDSTQLVDLLRNLPPFEFYLTNRSTEYLICFSHHDIVYAAGSATDWLRNRSRAIT